MRRCTFFAWTLCACLLTGCTAAAPRIESGAPPIAAPVLIGLDRAQVGAVLTAIGLTIGTATETYDASATAGIVTSQSPAPGVPVAPGSSVAIVVSKGPESAAVPNVVGTTKAAATSALESAGFKVTSRDKNDKAKKGSVIAQSPAKGSIRGIGATVTITVSTGVVMVRVPNIRGMVDPDPLLKRAGLKPKGIAIHGPIESDCAGFMEAYRQRPRAGTLVPKGTTVTYHYWWESA